MKQEDFWEIIERSKRDFDPDQRDGNLNRQAVLLEFELGKLSSGELENFIGFYHQFFWSLYTWDHWAAVYFVQGGCSDDGFDYFRAWVIGMGKKVFDEIVRSADALADVLDLSGIEDIHFEEFSGMADRIYFNKTGKAVPTAVYDSFFADEPLGIPFDEDRLLELEVRLPEIWNKFKSSWPQEQLR